MEHSYEKMKEELVQIMIKNQQAKENQKFGEFIIQSNNVQFYLSTLVILYSASPDKEYTGKVESGTLGQVINFFCACAKKEKGGFILIPKLRKYNTIRNKFAHKIHSPTKLTKDELQNAVLLGNDIMKYLMLLTDKEIKNRK